MHELKEHSNIYIPVDLDQIALFPHFNQEEILKNPKSIEMLFSLVISNATFPYRLFSYLNFDLALYRRNSSTVPNAINMSDYVNSLTPYPLLNIFNCYYELPDEELLMNFTISNGKKKLEPISIFEFKTQEKNVLFGLPKECQKMNVIT